MVNLTKSELHNLSFNIQQRSMAFYKHNKEICRFHNWKARIYAFIKKGRKVFPRPSEEDIKRYRQIELKSSSGRYNNEKRERSKKLFKPR